MELIKIEIEDTVCEESKGYLKKEKNPFVEQLVPVIILECIEGALKSPEFELKKEMTISIEAFGLDADEIYWEYKFI